MGGGPGSGGLNLQKNSGRYNGGIAGGGFNGLIQNGVSSSTGNQNAPTSSALIAITINGSSSVNPSGPNSSLSQA